MASIGQELKRERELRGISLKEIADATKINLRFLRALEEDQLDILPEQFFTRGIIRAYANYLGLDEQDALNTYLEWLQEKETAQEEAIKKPKVEEIFPKTVKRNISILFFLILVLGLAVTAYLLIPGKADKPPAPSSPPPSTAPARTPSVQTPPPPAETPPEQEKLVLDLTVHEITWMEIHTDGVLQYTGIKYPGTRLQFRATREIILHLGNAGGVSYMLNGEEGKTLGASGVVRKNIRITPDNFREFLKENSEKS
ncbi:MAG: helix-turn-helix domain-containing protein [Candidatus Aminicenantales bacterium]